MLDMYMCDLVSGLKLLRILSLSTSKSASEKRHIDTFLQPLITKFHHLMAHISMAITYIKALIRREPPVPKYSSIVEYTCE